MARQPNFFFLLSYINFIEYLKIKITLRDAVEMMPKGAFRVSTTESLASNRVRSVGKDLLTIFLTSAGLPAVEAP